MNLVPPVSRGVRAATALALVASVLALVASLLAPPVAAAQR